MHRDQEERDQHWMRHAMRLAEEAGRRGEVPVGAVLVDAQYALVAEGMNAMIGLNDATAHAEVQAIRAACEAVRNYRLPDTILYTTLEPCAMCAGVAIHARLGEVVYAASDPRAGADGSVLQVLRCPDLNHRITVRQGVLAEESAQLLRDFFAARRGKGA